MQEKMPDKIEVKRLSYRRPRALWDFFRAVRANPMKTIDNLMKSGEKPIDVFTIDTGISRLHIVAQPSLITQIFRDPRTFQKAPHYKNLISVFKRTNVFTSPFNDWIKQRNTIRPYLKNSKLPDYEATIATQAERFIGKLQTHGTDDLYDDFKSLTARSFFMALFDYDIDKHLPRLKHSVDTMSGFLISSITSPLTLIFRRHAFVPEDAREAIAFMRDFLEELAAPQLANKQEDHIVSDILESNGYYDATTDEQRENAKYQSLEEIMVLFIAGYESSAATLTWATYQLANDPDLQNTVRQEILQTVGDEPLDAKKLLLIPSLNYLIRETARLNPTLYVSIPRQAVQPITLEGGFQIAKGDYVLTPIKQVNTDPRWHKNPETFDIERHCPQNKMGRPRDSALTFLTGAHTCVGKPFFFTQASIVLAMMLEKLDLLPTERMPGKQIRTSMVPENGYGLNVKPRQQATQNETMAKRAPKTGCPFHKKI